MNKMTPSEFVDALNEVPPVRALAAIHTGAIDINAKDGGVPLLSRALEANSLDVIDKLIRYGANVNEYVKYSTMDKLVMRTPAVELGMAPIHFVKSAEAVQLLASANATIDAPYKDRDRAFGMRGETMLNTTALGNSKESLLLARALVDAGANVDAPYSEKEYKYGKHSILGLSERIADRVGSNILPRLEALREVFPGAWNKADLQTNSEQMKDHKEPSMSTGNTTNLKPPEGATLVKEGLHVGMIVDVTKDFAIQHSGRNVYKAHELARFDKPPVVGLPMDIQYRNGRVAADKNQGQTREAGHQR